MIAYTQVLEVEEQLKPSCDLHPLADVLQLSPYDRRWVTDRKNFLTIKFND